MILASPSRKRLSPFPAPAAFVSSTAPPRTMLLSAIKLQTPLSTTTATITNAATNLLFSSTAFHKPSHTGTKPVLLLTTTTTNASSSSPPLENTLHHVRETLPNPEPEADLSEISSASAVVSAIRGCSTSPVDFSQSIEDNRNHKLILPSPDFQRLCVQQLDLFRRIVHPDAVLSVYVRPAGSYVMDRLELRRVTSYPCVDVNSSDIVILVGNFSVPTGLRSAEASLCNQQVEIVPVNSAIVFPMVKHPFVVGFLVAELPKMELEQLRMNGHTEERDLMQFPSPGEAHTLSYGKPLGIQNNDEPVSLYNLNADQRSNAINISHTLAMAYVMDQKSILLQQSSWQNNIRMSNLVEQIRGPLSSIRTLSKMLSIHSKRNEISYDLVEDIMVQGDRIRDTLQELQEAVYLTKENIMRYNEDALKKISTSTRTYPESVRSQLPDNLPRHNGHELQDSGEALFLDTASKDIEMPMPPLALAPLKQHGLRPSDVSEVLSDLVEAVRPLAYKQQRILEFSKLSESLQVAIEEPSLRQALSNLIEGALLRTHVGGKVEIMTTGAPAGGALVIIDDDGPDMHYMTQTHSLTPFGAELSSENMVEDNMTWNFVAGLTVASEILESYGCVVRVKSPRIAEAALGSGGTRVELWLPSLFAESDSNGLVHEG